MQLFSLQGQVAFVTGAGSGIGQAIAVGLAEAGADVACFDLPGSPGIASTVERIQALGRRALALSGTVTERAALDAAVARTEAELGQLSVAINCAGIANAQAAEDLDLQRWQTTLDINLTGIFLSCQAQAAVMLPRGKGAIVNIASMSGSIVNRGRNGRPGDFPRQPGLVFLHRCRPVGRWRLCVLVGVRHVPTI
jgi:NAD(P)-dependent dehydrogenase (short-subunit alcohol dehydrogenase family)